MRALVALAWVSSFTAFACLGASPGSAQTTTVGLVGVPLAFPSPTTTDYSAGSVAASTSVIATVTVVNLGLGTATTTVSIKGPSSTWNNGKPIGDLEWRLGAAGSWNPLTTSNVTIEARTQPALGITNTWDEVIYFRARLRWASDSPGARTASFTITASQTQP